MRLDDVQPLRFAKSPERQAGLSKRRPKVNPQRALVVGLAGPMGAGKSTVARALQKSLGFRVLPFAGPLKAMLAALGVPERHLLGSLEEKAAPLDLLGGKSARHAMQTLGTQWGRQMISPDIWIAAWTAQASATGEPVIADDVRFPNEAAAVRALGGVVLWISRPSDDLPDICAHESELQTFPADAVIANTLTERALILRAKKALAELGVLAPRA